MSQRPHSRPVTAAVALLAAASMFAALPGTATAAESASKANSSSQLSSKEALRKLVAQKGYVSSKIRNAQGPTLAFVQVAKKSGVEQKVEKLNGNQNPSAAQEKSANQAAKSQAAQASRTADQVAAALKKLDPNAQVQYTTSYAISGLAVQADALALTKLASSNPQVVRVVPLPQHTASVVGDPDAQGLSVAGGPESPTNKNSDNLTRAVKAWAQTGKTGKGVNVAIVDTGFDFTHADFGGAGTAAAYETAYQAQDQDPLTNPALKGLLDPAKYKGGYDFAGAAYGSAGADGKPVTKAAPDPNPIDGPGGHHGTHVAGTALGFGVNGDGTTFRGDYTKLTNGEVSGMRIGPGSAPEAGVYALKVFGDNGGSTGLTLQALDWVAKHNTEASDADKISLVSMSLGGTFGTIDDPENEAVDNLAASGVLSVIAAGNEGDVTDMLGDPGGAPSSLTVAASSSGKTVQDALRVEDGADSLKGQLLAGQYSINLGSDFDVTAEVARVTDPANLDGCSPYSDEDKARVAGKIAYVDWNDKDVKCGSGKRFNNAQDAGAVGILFASQSDIPEAGIGGNATLPGLQLVKSAAENPDFQKAVDAGTLKVTLATSLKHAKDADYSAQFEDTVASFTSRGLHGSYDGTVKPDVAAPGVGIVSASAGSGNQFELMSGTSMATPLTSGIAALVREAHPDFTAEQVKAQIVNTADHNVLNEDRSKVEAPIRVGTGRVDALAAVNNQVQLTSADQGAVSVQFGVVQVPQGGTTLRKKVVVTNNSDVDRSYRAEYLARTETPGVSYTLSANQVSVPAHGSASLTVTFKADQAALRHTKDSTMADQWLGVDREYVTDASGVVKLTPVSPAVGADPAAVGLRVAVTSAPRPVSETHADLLGLNGGDAKLKLSGHGVKQGEGKEAYDSQAYPMVLSKQDAANGHADNPYVQGHRSLASGDLRAIGYSSTAAQLEDPSQGLFSVGFVTDKAWQNLYGGAFISSVWLDVNSDGKPDYEMDVKTKNDDPQPKDLDSAEVVTTKFGTTDVVDTEKLDPRFMFDSNQMVMSTKLSALGFTKDSKNPEINFMVVTYSLYSSPILGYLNDLLGFDKDTTVNPYAPAMSFGPLSEQGKKAMEDAKAAAKDSDKPAPAPSESSSKVASKKALKQREAKRAAVKAAAEADEPADAPAANAGQVSFDDQDGQTVPVHMGPQGSSKQTLTLHNLAQAPVRAEDVTTLDVDSVQPVDPQKLQDAVDQYSQLNKDEWTSTTWAELQKQIEAAKAVLADPNADQQAIDDAYQALVNAYNGLVARATGVSRDRLRAAVGAGNKLNPGDYTSETADPFVAALKAAQDVLNNPDSTQEEVDGALDALLKAMDALEKKPAEQPGKDEKPGQPSEPGKPGQPSEPGKPAEPGKGGKPAAKVVAQASRSRLGETGASANLVALGALVLLATGSALTLLRRKNHTTVDSEEE
ncbi:MAG TPA: S8 family serine peptidase [Aeriscardovia aeriphila]|uniref:S8 family serine peptidase n=1 Tax=Aeriscardovia aeriphila TaxID=218139 RepID=A0A921FT37_9BIFI|nr:S8 family serine peptidase [Aeriscardovia aeriphila]